MVTVFCGFCFQETPPPTPPPGLHTADTAGGGGRGAEGRTQASLAIDALASQSIRHSGNQKAHDSWAGRYLQWVSFLWTLLKRHVSPVASACLGSQFGWPRSGHVPYRQVKSAGLWGASPASILALVSVFREPHTPDPLSYLSLHSHIPFRVLLQRWTVVMCHVNISHVNCSSTLPIGPPAWALKRSNLFSTVQGKIHA